MGSQLTTLTSSDIQRFERDGYVVVRQAFSPPCPSVWPN